jgi:hypothetical protein
MGSNAVKKILVTFASIFVKRYPGPDVLRDFHHDTKPVGKTPLLRGVCLEQCCQGSPEALLQELATMAVKRKRPRSISLGLSSRRSLEERGEEERPHLLGPPHKVPTGALSMPGNRLFLFRTWTLLEPFYEKT